MVAGIGSKGEWWREEGWEVPQVTGVIPVRVLQVAIDEALMQLLGIFYLLSVQLLSRLMVAGGNAGVVGGEGGSRGWQKQLLQTISGKGLGFMFRGGWF
jgi:hypothetical protein